MTAIIRKAEKDDVQKVLSLYRSLVGTYGCVWDEMYPALENVITDIENTALYVLCTQKGEIIGAAAAPIDDEQNELICWNPKFKNPCEISRVGIKKEWQHKGLAKKLITFIENEIKSNGNDCIRLLAFKDNKNAVELYKSLSYINVGEVKMYGNGLYICFEKSLI